MTEAQANDGSIETPPVKIYACGGATFAKTGATLVSGTDYNLSGLPAGLTATVATAADGKSATLTVAGNATAHALSNSVNNVYFSFTNAAVAGGGVSSILNNKDTLAIDFYEPWGRTCENPTGVIATVATPWTRFETKGPMPRYYGLWYDAGGFYLENYGRGIITASLTSDDIVFLPTGTPIGPSSAWRMGGNQGLLYSPSYTALDGQTGYVGIRMQAQNDFYYGWMKIQVTATGVTLLEYQYNHKPNYPINAGAGCFTLENEAINTIHNTTVYPNPSQGTFYIENSDPAIIGKEYALFFMDGRKVKSGTISTNRQEVNCENLASGVYLLQVINNAGQVESTSRLSIVK